MIGPNSIFVQNDDLIPYHNGKTLLKRKSQKGMSECQIEHVTCISTVSKNVISSTFLACHYHVHNFFFCVNDI